jgi:hypothetical protein
VWKRTFSLIQTFFSAWLSGRAKMTTFYHKNHFHAWVWHHSVSAPLLFCEPSKRCALCYQ